MIKAGAAEIEITPPIAVGFLASSIRKEWEAFRRVRKPLKASVIALESGSRRVALCSVDLLGFASEAVNGWDRFVSSIAKQSGEIAPEELILSATHTHSSPETLALSECFKTAIFQEWLAGLETRIGRCIEKAFSELRPVTLAWASGQTENLTHYRRIKTPEGIQLSHTFDGLHSLDIPREKVDERVRCLIARDFTDGTPVAFLVHATCHPVYEMCLPEISPDFPGELAVIFQSKVAPVPVLFLNGAAATINPWQVSGGGSCARTHAQEIFKAIEPALETASIIPAETFSLSRSTVTLGCRPVPGDSLPSTVSAECAILAFPELALLFLPGEPFLETAAHLEAESPFEETIVVGYSGNSIGYIPTEEAFDEGGYETGPGRWSYLTRDSERLLRAESLKLVQTVSGNLHTEHTATTA